MSVQGVQVVLSVNRVMYILVQCRCVVFGSVHFVLTGCPQYCTECAVIHSSRAGGGEGGVDGGWWREGWRVTRDAGSPALMVVGHTLHHHHIVSHDHDHDHVLHDHSILIA